MSEINRYKVVFEGEDWSIIADKTTITGYIASHVACNPEDGDEYNKYAVKEHTVKEHDDAPGIMSWFHNEEEPICYYCGATVPAEIQALMHLACSF